MSDSCKIRQIYPYLSQIFSNYHYGFRKGFSAQHYFMTMIEKWCQSLDTGGHAGFFFSILQIYKDSQFNNTKIKNSKIQCRCAPQ